MIIYWYHSISEKEVPQLKVKSAFKKYTCWFEFFINPDELFPEIFPGTKSVDVRAAILSEQQVVLWSGVVSVKVNEFGIFPEPKQARELPVPDTIKKMFLLELRRYIKPQKAFL